MPSGRASEAEGRGARPDNRRARKHRSCARAFRHRGARSSRGRPAAERSRGSGRRSRPRDRARRAQRRRQRDRRPSRWTRTERSRWRAYGGLRLSSRGVSAIEVSGLRKSYGSHEVLHGVSFEVRTGEVFALLGPNGAGKTTTVEILEGYRNRDAGEVRVLGNDPGSAGSAFRARIGIVLQSSAVYPLLTVRETLDLFA